MAIEKLLIEGNNNLFSYLFQAVPPDLAVLHTASPASFWMGLEAEGKAPWPGSEPTGLLVRLGQLPDGGLFSVEDEAGLLLLAAFGFDGPGEAWEELRATVGAIRLRVEAEIVRRARPQGLGMGAGVQVEWSSASTPPDRDPWLALVPMMSLGAYPAESEAVLERARTIGLDLLTIYGAGLLGEPVLPQL